jgi:hypothetical protein
MFSAEELTTIQLTLGARVKYWREESRAAIRNPYAGPDDLSRELRLHAKNRLAIKRLMRKIDIELCGYALRPMGD